MGEKKSIYFSPYCCYFLINLFSHNTFCYSVAKSYPTLRDPMDCSMPGFPVLHHLPDFDQVHVHFIGDAIQPSQPLLVGKWIKIRCLKFLAPPPPPHYIWLMWIFLKVLSVKLSKVSLFFNDMSHGISSMSSNSPLIIVICVQCLGECLKSHHLLFQE